MTLPVYHSWLTRTSTSRPLSVENNDIALKDSFSRVLSVTAVQSGPSSHLSEHFYCHSLAPAVGTSQIPANKTIAITAVTTSNSHRKEKFNPLLMKRRKSKYNSKQQCVREEHENTRASVVD